MSRLAESLLEAQPNRFRHQAGDIPAERDYLLDHP
jgi:hypothetical protein